MIECFKAYDIRGRVPEELNEEIVWRIGRAYAQYLQPRRVVVGRDVRLQSPALAQAVSAGLMAGGADVIDIGLCGTEEVYFQTFHRRADGGIMVTASHNPMNYNGMKLVREGSRPISGDTGLNDIKALAEANGANRGQSPVSGDRDRCETSGGDSSGTEMPEFTRGAVASGARAGSADIPGFVDETPSPGALVRDDSKDAYIDHLIGYIDRGALKPLKIVVNAGNGCAGPVIDLLADRLPFDFIRVNHEPDGAFPNGIPNPLLPENRSATADAVIRHGADLGLAWDGDFDRCFFFDEQGRFIEGYYLVGLLAQVLLKKAPGAAIIHDPRLTWNTVEMVTEAGGRPVQSKTGHAFIKERMRAEDALYGGEMSAHHYFRDFAYCDSGMIPWLLVAEHICKTGRPLSALVDARMVAYPCSGEINFAVEDVAATLARIRNHFAPQNPAIDTTDGLGFTFPDWRFNVRSSNTEPLLRLNVETRADEPLLRAKVDEIFKLIGVRS